jgi:peptide/nickel transport system substrate-binding protein
LLSLGGGVPDPSAHLNVIKSSGFTHQWFPRQKSPSTDWEARMDDLMEAQNKTLDFNARKKDFDEVQLIMSEQVPMIFTVTPYFYAAARRDIGNLRPTPLSAYRATWNAEELYFKK